jgi:hypothetical protein
MQLGTRVQRKGAGETYRAGSGKDVRPIHQVEYVAPLGCVPYRLTKNDTEEVLAGLLCTGIGGQKE